VGRGAGLWLAFISVAALMLALSSTVIGAAAADVMRAPDTASAASLYLKYCAQCHGRSGNGDGPRAAQFKTHIRSFANCAWMAMRSDATLFLIIRDGSGAIGLLPEMPPFDGKLDDQQIAELIGYVRRFCVDRSGGHR
jgi:cytochrome c oxidase cbb3-type subunit III